jgi:hypothetical protein
MPRGRKDPLVVELHCTACGKATGVALEMERQMADGFKPRPEDVVVAAKHVPVCPEVHRYVHESPVKPGEDPFGDIPVIRSQMLGKRSLEAHPDAQ